MRSRTSSGVNQATSLASAVGRGVPLKTRHQSTATAQATNALAAPITARPARSATAAPRSPPRIEPRCGTPVAYGESAVLG
jgi:hypothetical protein